MTMAALFVPHPFDLGLDLLVLLQRRQRAKEHADGVPPADRVLCQREVLCKLQVRVARGRRRDRQYVHGLAVQPRDRLVDGVLRRRPRAPRQTHAVRAARPRVVVRVREPRAPARCSAAVCARDKSDAHQWQKSLEMTKSVSARAR